MSGSGASGEGAREVDGRRARYSFPIASAAVTGAFSFTGRAIAEELLRRGETVRTLSRADAPDDPLRRLIDVAPLVFDPSTLRASLEGTETLYNTYWVRFERRGVTFSEAVTNTIQLFEAAVDVGVRHIVHISVANADRADDLPYFAEKHRLEQWLVASGIEHTIVRPTLVFGPRDILINNLAWMLRRTPLFLLPGAGDYQVQPVSVDDVARIAIETPTGMVDAAGPETMSFATLVSAIREAVGARARVARGPRTVGLIINSILGRLIGDVIVTADELEGLSRSLLVSGSEAEGTERITDWLREEAATLGRSYTSEIRRNYLA
jgi:NADH dehydrogenase